jgi:hypothetical protein
MSKTKKLEGNRIESATLVKANTQDGYKVWRESIRVMTYDGKEYWITFDDIQLISLLKTVCK